MVYTTHGLLSCYASQFRKIHMVAFAGWLIGLGGCWAQHKEKREQSQRRLQMINWLTGLRRCHFAVHFASGRAWERKKCRLIALNEWKTVANDYQRQMRFVSWPRPEYRVDVLRRYESFVRKSLSSWLLLNEFHSQWAQLFVHTICDDTTLPSRKLVWNITLSSSCD